MTETTETYETLKRIYRDNTASQLNAVLAQIDSLTQKFPGVMVEFFATARTLCLEECSRRNRSRELWQSGQTGFYPRGYLGSADEMV